MNDDNLGPVYPDGLPGHNETDTSLEAAVTVAPRLREKQWEVYRLVLGSERAGATAHQVSARSASGMPVQSVNSRTNELHKLGLIADSGLRRIGREGKRCIVWIDPVLALPYRPTEPVPWFYGEGGDTWKRPPRKRNSSSRASATSATDEQ